jgi:hypothetical protein
MALLKDSERLITGEELFHSPDFGPCELVDGRIVPTMPRGDEPADVEAELGMRLRAYGKETRCGRAGLGSVSGVVFGSPRGKLICDEVSFYETQPSYFSRSKHR